MRVSLPILLVAICFRWHVDAAVVRLEIAERTPIDSGYECWKGKVFFTVDPKHPRNRRIVDLENAPKNSQGFVEFSADFYSLRPRSSSKNNGTLLFEVLNRGKKGMIPMFNRASPSADPRTAAELGDGLLLRDGYTLVWVGWQHDVPPPKELMRLHAPAAKGVKGLVRSEFTPTKPVDRFPLGDAGHVPYPPIRPEAATVTVRDEIYGSRQTLPAGSWRLENNEVRLAAPATPGRIYEIVYESTDPAIAGLGLAAIRDLISYLKREWALPQAIGFGTSQSAMVLRGFLYEGFNADEQGKQVFDGVLAHVAGARRSTFQRFTQPSRTAGPLRNASLSTTEQGPYTDDDLLSQARTDRVVPKIFYTNSSYEYWGSAASLIHTSPDGERDVAPSATTRIYLLAGGQHGPAAFPPADAGGRNLPNFNDYRWILRSLLARMQAWVAQGTEPPPSAHPTLVAKTLVPVSAYAFDRAEKPAILHIPHALDFGPEYGTKGIVTREPPRVGRAYAPRVPQADRAGNDLGGVRMPELECPLASFTGWNLRSTKIGASSYLLGNTGSYIPFRNAEISQAFSDEAAYQSCVERAASALSRQGFLNATDIPEVRKSASRHWQWRMGQAVSSIK